MEEGLDNLKKKEEEELKMYVHKERGNTLYVFSDVALFSAMRDSLIWSNGKDFKKLESEIFRIGRLFQDFGYECFQIIIEQIFELEYEECEIPDPPNYTDVKLPFFISKENT